MLRDDTLDHLSEAAAEPDLSNTKYEIVGALGRGGSATVYLAYDRELDREVALKVLDLPDAGGAVQERLLREAKIVARLEHPGIVPIHDVGILPDDRVFYAMKHVKGRRLDAFEKESQDECLRVFQKICEAVAFAHSQGVIHRDLKPENIMVGGFGEVLVMDWGIAKIRDAQPDLDSGTEKNPGPRLTDHGTVMGTRAYMSPEQVAGDTEKFNERTDIYGLGAVLYFLLTGVAPFEEIRSSRALIPPRRTNPRAAKAIEAVCLKAMAEQQVDRYGDALELGKDVEMFLASLPVSAYRENPLEITQRWIAKNYFVILLVLTYLIMRTLLLLFSGR